MSGPWDRPSSGDSDTWPSEDLGPSEDRSSSFASRAARDPATDGAPGWDDWPSPPPPQDEYYVDEPIRPSSDPWAESWTVEEADAMLGSAPPAREPDRWTEPAPDWQPSPPPEPPATYERQPYSAPEPEPFVAPDVWPEPEPEPEPSPRIEPWSSDIDPWRFEPEAPAEEAQATAAAPEVEPAAPAAVEPEPAEPEPAEPQHVVAEPVEAEAGEAEPGEAEPVERDPAAGPGAGPEVQDRHGEPVPEPAVRWPAARDELPDWLAEPLPATTTEAPVVDATTAAPEDEPAVEGEPVAEAEITKPVEAQPDAAATVPSAELEPASVPFWKSILPWRSSEPDTADEPEVAQPAAPEARATLAEAADETEAPVEADAEVEVEDTAELAASAEPVDVAGIQPRWETDAPETVEEQPTATVIEPAPAPERATAEAPEADTPTFVPITGGLTYQATQPWPEADDAAAPEPAEEGWSAPSDDVWAEMAATAAAWQAQVDAEPPTAVEPVPEPEPQPEPRLEPQDVSPLEPEAETEFEAPAAASTGWADPEWSDGGESTRVLPTDWTATKPERAAATDDLQAGAIRTRLAEREPDLDEDEQPATVAEQAVPWLIGVILLLAGMVIVLLALIFAGDGSLGGGADASPGIRPTLAAVAGTAPPRTTASATPAESPSSEPTSTPEPTATPPPAPEYGPLEMVYQGRSAALAPIYLLHHDFTVEEEPAVLAQDSDLDVRRFAWAPDGTVGAGLLSDVLVSIEPGKEKRRLGDGLSAITFGENASTLYTVRVTEDGDDDVATIVAIDFESGDTDDLASVSYSRPEVRTRRPLGEAAFSDDGGPVRLYWTAQDRLHLWVSGAGAWRIDPADGAVTPLDGEPLPVLWSPDGNWHVDVSEDGGTATLTLRNANGRAMARTEVEGVASHVRWSPASNGVVFTLGRSASGGGVLQDLFLWNLDDGEAPRQLTSTGAAFGAEWLGTQPMWRGE